HASLVAQRVRSFPPLTRSIPMTARPHLFSPRRHSLRPPPFHWITGMTWPKTSNTTQETRYDPTLVPRARRPVAGRDARVDGPGARHALPHPAQHHQRLAVQVAHWHHAGGAAEYDGPDE